ncbi:MAG: DNA-3-methyladenine glycosylase 2 family protein [Ruminococcaceae bacterium]|nr:DNA-3-methyladenine glycosylase 2 family protein [Oscillospiraceae bacterium]
MGALTYTKEHTEYLSSKDERLGAFISHKGYVERMVFDDVFSGLCYNIVNQQLSMKACETLWGKLTAAVVEVVPESCTDVARLKACGLSQSKADCIAACAERFISSEITAEKLRAMTDAEVTAALTGIKGIGRWTAEMTLIFCLGRMDVLSLSDFGIRKGLSLLHGMDMKDIKAMEKYRELYSPYGTVASVYLWEAARELPEKKEK